jgi:hypothetical protein
MLRKRSKLLLIFSDTRRNDIDERLQGGIFNCFHYSRQYGAE